MLARRTRVLILNLGHYVEWLARAKLAISEQVVRKGHLTETFSIEP
jgi:hypothetical protein